MSNQIQVLEINSSNDLVMALNKFPFVAGIYDDNGGLSNGPAFFPNDPGYMTVDQERKVIEAGLGKWTNIYHYDNDGISELSGIEIDDLNDPDGYALDRIESWLSEKGKNFAHYTSTGDWYVEA